jgi:hypothetical protein
MIPVAVAIASEYGQISKFAPKVFYFVLHVNKHT